MSSKLFLPEDAQTASPMVWRQIDGAGQAAPGAPEDAAHALQAKMAQLERQCEQRVQEARSAGLREGEAAGRTRAAAEMQPVLERLARSIAEIGQLRARLRREAEADLVRLSLAVARRVLRREMAVDPDAMRGLVVSALEKLQGQEICRVRVHPAHAAQVTAWLEKPGMPAHIEVLADSSREPGAVIFETARGSLDASVETQLQEIERGLADRLRQHA